MHVDSAYLHAKNSDAADVHRRKPKIFPIYTYKERQQVPASHRFEPLHLSRFEPLRSVQDFFRGSTPKARCATSMFLPRFGSKVNAIYRYGVLELTLPKRADGKGAKKLTVN